MLLTGALVAGGAYGAALAAMYGLQRRLMYPGSAPSEPPAACGLAGVAAICVPARDGTPLLAWWMPPAAGRPVVLYWHGNAGPLHCRASKFAAFGRNGYGMLMLAYRGYSGNPGRSSQPAILADAAAAAAWVAAETPAAQVYFGESLGGGVAMHLAARRAPAAIVLEGAFDSAARLAQRRYPIFPAARLIRDRWDNRRLAPACPAPVLMLHGGRDRTVPAAHARRLFAALPEPKRFVDIPSGGHVDLFDHGGAEATFAWLAERGL